MAWRVCQNILLVWKRLTQKGIQLDTRYQFRGEAESVSHVFKECQDATKVQRIGPVWGQSREISRFNFQLVNRFQKSTSSSGQKISVYADLMRHIVEQKTRNQLIYYHQKLDEPSCFNPKTSTMVQGNGVKHGNRNGVLLIPQQ